jgi:hypothetical protein
MYVSDEFRTNHLSLKPGGSTVQIIYKNGEVRIYDKIKYPKAYIEKLPKEDIQSISLDGKEIYLNI